MQFKGTGRRPKQKLADLWEAEVSPGGREGVGAEMIQRESGCVDGWRGAGFLFQAGGLGVR